jgi:hypothetical protein
MPFIDKLLGLLDFPASDGSFLGHYPAYFQAQEVVVNEKTTNYHGDIAKLLL